MCSKHFKITFSLNVSLTLFPQLICYRIPVHVISVAEPEPVERPLFARTGAQVFRPASGSGYVSYKMLQKVLNFAYKNLKLFKKKIFVVFYITEPFYDRFWF
jgi:hypothetical protein